MRFSRGNLRFPSKSRAVFIRVTRIIMIYDENWVCQTAPPLAPSLAPNRSTLPLLTPFNAPSVLGVRINSSLTCGLLDKSEIHREVRGNEIPRSSSVRYLSEQQSHKQKKQTVLYNNWREVQNIFVDVSDKWKRGSIVWWKRQKRHYRFDHVWSEWVEKISRDVKTSAASRVKKENFISRLVRRVTINCHFQFLLFFSF